MRELVQKYAMGDDETPLELKPLDAKDAMVGERPKVPDPCQPLYGCFGYERVQEAMRLCHNDVEKAANMLADWLTPGADAA